MLDIESSLKLLKKYGYNSKNVHPYLYINGKDIGITYSYIDTKYGALERLFIFKNEIELETFLKKYQWFKLNGKNYNVQMKLNNYEIANPKVVYIRNNHAMMDEEIFNIEIYDKRKKMNDKLSHTKRLIIEIENLINRYDDKKEEIEKYINNYVKKTNDLNKHIDELQSLIKQYTLKKIVIEKYPIIDDYKVSNESINNIKESLEILKKKTIKEREAYGILYRIWNLNKSLEINEIYLKALKENDDLDEIIRLIVTKIEFMKDTISKKSLFKINIKKNFERIESSSTYKSVYGPDFSDKYKSFIEKKYDVIDKVNEFRLCEYLNDFTVNREYAINKNIERCKYPTSAKQITYTNDYPKEINHLKKDFNKNLNEDEKNVLILYSSIYQKLFDMIMDIEYYEDINELINLLKITDGSSKIIEECYTKIKYLVELDNNKEIKNTIFKNINFNDLESFIKSILKYIDILSNIKNKITLKNNIRLFFGINDINLLDKIKFIHTKGTITSFMLNKGNGYKVLVANVDKGINCLVSPFYIKIEDNNILLIEDLNPEIIINRKDVLINVDNNDIIFTRFKTNIVETPNYNYVDDFSVNYKIIINKIKIEKREQNEQ